jgi:hypothetical protein
MDEQRMDQHQADEDQVEDLAVEGEEVQDVKGGSLKWGEPPGASPQLGANSGRLSAGQERMGLGQQHNETLISI